MLRIANQQTQDLTHTVCHSRKMYDLNHSCNSTQISLQCSSLMRYVTYLSGICGVQRQKEAQAAQAAQEARHEQAKRKAKLEAGFAEVNANKIDRATMAYDCCL